MNDSSQSSLGSLPLLAKLSRLVRYLSKKGEHSQAFRLSPILSESQSSSEVAEALTTRALKSRSPKRESMRSEAERSPLAIVNRCVSPSSVHLVYQYREELRV